MKDEVLQKISLTDGSEVSLTAVCSYHNIQIIPLLHGDSFSIIVVTYIYPSRPFSLQLLPRVVWRVEILQDAQERGGEPSRNKRIFVPFVVNAENRTTAPETVVAAPKYDSLDLYGAKRRCAHNTRLAGYEPV